MILSPLSSNVKMSPQETGDFHDEHWSVEEPLRGKRQSPQFGRALEQLGVTFIAAQTPQAKGRIERLWGSFQDRRTGELRLAEARDLQASNQVLRCFVHERVVSNDHVVPWDGRRLQIPPQPHRCSFAGARVQLFESLEGKAAIYDGDTKLQHAGAGG